MLAAAILALIASEIDAFDRLLHFADAIGDGFGDALHGGEGAAGGGLSGTEPADPGSRGGKQFERLAECFAAERGERGFEAGGKLGEQSGCGFQRLADAEEGGFGQRGGRTDGADCRGEIDRFVHSPTARGVAGSDRSGSGVVADVVSVNFRWGRARSMIFWHQLAWGIKAAGH